MAVDPLKPFGAEIVAVQGGSFDIKPVEVTDDFMDTLMQGVVEDIPIKRAFCIPFGALAKF